MIFARNCTHFLQSSTIFFCFDTIREALLLFCHCIIFDRTLSLLKPREFRICVHFSIDASRHWGFDVSQNFIFVRTERVFDTYAISHNCSRRLWRTMTTYYAFRGFQYGQFRNRDNCRDLITERQSGSWQVVTKTVTYRSPKFEDRRG